MSAGWQCASCNLINDIYRSKCQACFHLCPKPHCHATLSRLYCKISPKSKQLKRLLVYGFCKLYTISTIPLDIIKICSLYYDEAIHWRVNSNKLKQYYMMNETQNKADDTKNKLYGDIFCINNIKFRCSLIPTDTNYNDCTAFYLNTLLPENVQSVFVYTEVLCVENKAEYKRAANFIRNESNDGTASIWKKQEYLMQNIQELINNHNEIVFRYYFEILSITYNDDTYPFYKRILMKKEVEYEWKIDQIFLKTLRNAIPRQFFLSDTFDEINNNWGLWILPMGFKDVDLQNRLVYLRLNLYKKPLEIKQLTIKCIISNNYDENISETTLVYDDLQTWYYLPSLFKSLMIYDTNSLVLNCKVCIETVQFNDNYYDTNYSQIIQ